AACVENIVGGTMNTLTKLSLSLHAACLALCVTAAAQAAGLQEPSADPMKTAQQLDRQGLDLEARFYYGKALMRNPQDLAALADGGDEFAILQLDAVHRHVHLRHVDLLFLAVEEVVVARDVGGAVADVAEERAERPVVVERQRQRADRAVLRLQLDAHVH